MYVLRNLSPLHNPTKAPKPEGNIFKQLPPPLSNQNIISSSP